MTLFKNFWWVFAVSLLVVLHFNNNKLSIQLVELKLWLHRWPILISRLSRPYHTMLEQQYPNTLIWPPSHTTLLMRTTSQLLKNMLIAAKMTPYKSWVLSRLPLLMNLLGLLITLRTDPKSSPGPRVTMLWHFPVLFFLLCSPSISELLPEWPGWPEGSQLKVSVLVLFTHT